MVEPSDSPSSTSSPPSKIFLEEDFPKLPESLEDQGVELGIILSIQPLSSCPLPTSNTRSPADFGLESLDNPIQTLEISLTIDSQLGLVIYPFNPLVNPVVISP